MKVLFRMNASRGVVAAFDFDGTIIYSDSFREFLYFTFGWRRFTTEMIGMADHFLRYLLGFESRDLLKERVVKAFLTDKSLVELGQHANVFTRQILCRIRPKANDRILWHKQQGHRLVMVSASLDVYLKPIATILDFDDLLCTKLAVQDGYATGEISGANCRGPEKVRRLEKLLGTLGNYEIHAYGDSLGDKEMLAIADHPYFRPFE